MAENRTWEALNELVGKHPEISIIAIIKKAWQIYKSQAFAFSGFTILISCAMVALTFILGQIGWIIYKFVVLPCLLMGFATFAKQLKEGTIISQSGSVLFDGFQQVLSLGLVAMSKSLLFTAALAPSIILLNNAGLDQILAEIQQTLINQETVDFASFRIELSLLNKFVIGLNMFFALYLSISFSWASKLVFFKKVTFYQGIEGSRKLITPIGWKVLALFVTLWLTYVIVSFVLILLSALLGPIFAFLSIVGIAVGLIVLIPLSFISSYLFFEQVLSKGHFTD